MTIFIDANIPMYAGGTHHPYRKPCQEIILRIASGELNAVTDAEVFQEILYRYFAISEREKGFKIFDAFYKIMEHKILPVLPGDVNQARQLAEDHPHLTPRDLIHLAVMFNNDVLKIISADKGYDGIKGIERIDPTNVS